MNSLVQKSLTCVLGTAVIVIIIIITNGNDYSATGCPCTSSLTMFYNDVKIDTPLHCMAWQWVQWPPVKASKLAPTCQWMAWSGNLWTALPAWCQCNGQQVSSWSARARFVDWSPQDVLWCWGQLPLSADSQHLLPWAQQSRCCKLKQKLRKWLTMKRPSNIDEFSLSACNKIINLPRHEWNALP